MKRMTRVTLLGLLGVLLLFSLLGGTGQAFVHEAQSEPPILARVEVTGVVDDLGLPVYAHLQDAAGNDYALVIAPLSQLDLSAAGYTVLDPEMDGTPYLIALERRPGARPRATQVVNVLHDDGRHLVARAMPGEGEALAGMGFDIQWLDEAPMVMGAPMRLAAEALAVEYDPTIAGMINQVQQSTVYTYDGNLSGEWPVSIGGSDYTITTRYTRSGTPIQKATQYTYEFMQDLGLAVSYHNWTYGGTSNRNVIGEQTGTTQSADIVLITAHLDDVPSSGLAPGADDNASGSVGVMVAADILSQHQFERTIRYVFFTGEEQGLYGSRRYADLVSNAGDNIVAVYNMDMIAWDAIDGPTLRLHTRTTGSSGYAGDRAIADVFVDVVDNYGLSSSLTPIIDADGITASDHSSFWNKGYSAILAIEDDEDDFCAYYHTSNDRLQYLNMVYFTNYTKASVGTAAHLALLDSGLPATPTPTATPTNTPTPTATPTNTPTPTATPQPGVTIHVGDLDGSSADAPRGRWEATVTITIHDSNEGALSGALVEGSWSGGASGGGSCTTNASGQCSVVKGNLKANVPSVTFSVSNVTSGVGAYVAGDNHDPDGDSDGTAIIVSKPVDNTPPTVSITTPSDGATYASGATIDFAGTASDVEDGDVTASLVWTSDIDGQIGAGGSFSAALSDGVHTITATATDSGGASGSDTVGITVGNPPVVHVGDLDGVGQPVRSKWEATVTITVHDQNHNPLANATVAGTWSAGATGGAECTADGSGQCSVAKGNLKFSVPSVTFTVDSVTHATNTYTPADNHDPDGDSDGTSITVLQPS
jgi:protocatechuate 3,4-dioxygenase beta subunit